MDIEKELRRNVRELQGQLQRSYERIKTLQDELDAERRKNSNHHHFKSGMSGWALMQDYPPHEDD